MRTFSRLCLAVTLSFVLVAESIPQMTAPIPHPRVGASIEYLQTQNLTATAVWNRLSLLRESSSAHIKQLTPIIHKPFVQWALISAGVVAECIILFEITGSWTQTSIAMMLTLGIVGNGNGHPNGNASKSPYRVRIRYTEDFYKAIKRLEKSNATHESDLWLRLSKEIHKLTAFEGETSRFKKALKGVRLCEFKWGEYDRIPFRILPHRESREYEVILSDYFDRKESQTFARGKLELETKTIIAETDPRFLELNQKFTQATEKLAHQQADLNGDTRIGYIPTEEDLEIPQLVAQASSLSQVLAIPGLGDYLYYFHHCDVQINKHAKEILSAISPDLIVVGQLHKLLPEGQLKQHLRDAIETLFRNNFYEHDLVGLSEDFMQGVGSDKLLRDVLPQIVPYVEAQRTARAKHRDAAPTFNRNGKTKAAQTISVDAPAISREPLWLQKLNEVDLSTIHPLIVDELRRRNMEFAGEVLEDQILKQIVAISTLQLSRKDAYDAFQQVTKNQWPIGVKAVSELSDSIQTWQIYLQRGVNPFLKETFLEAENNSMFSLWSHRDAEGADSAHVTNLASEVHEAILRAPKGGRAILISPSELLEDFFVLAELEKFDEVIFLEENEQEFRERLELHGASLPKNSTFIHASPMFLPGAIKNKLESAFQMEWPTQPDQLQKALTAKSVELIKALERESLFEWPLEMTEMKTRPTHLIIHLTTGLADPKNLIRYMERLMFPGYFENKSFQDSVLLNPFKSNAYVEWLYQLRLHRDRALMNQLVPNGIYCRIEEPIRMQQPSQPHEFYALANALISKFSTFDVLEKKLGYKETQAEATPNGNMQGRRTHAWGHQNPYQNYIGSLVFSYIWKRHPETMVNALKRVVPTVLMLFGVAALVAINLPASVEFFHQFQTYFTQHAISSKIMRLSLLGSLMPLAMAQSSTFSNARQQTAKWINEVKQIFDGAKRPRTVVEKLMTLVSQAIGITPISDDLTLDFITNAAIEANFLNDIEQQVHQLWKERFPEFGFIFPWFQYSNLLLTPSPEVSIAAEFKLRHFWGETTQEIMSSHWTKIVLISMFLRSNGGSQENEFILERKILSMHLRRMMSLILEVNEKENDQIVFLSGKSNKNPTFRQLYLWGMLAGLDPEVLFNKNKNEFKIGKHVFKSQKDALEFYYFGQGQNKLQGLFCGYPKTNEVAFQSMVQELVEMAQWSPSDWLKIGLAHPWNSRLENPIEFFRLFQRNAFHTTSIPQNPFFAVASAGRTSNEISKSRNLLARFSSSVLFNEVWGSESAKHYYPDIKIPDQGERVDSPFENHMSQAAEILKSHTFDHLDLQIIKQWRYERNSELKEAKRKLYEIFCLLTKAGSPYDAMSWDTFLSMVNYRYQLNLNLDVLLPKSSTSVTMAVRNAFMAGGPIQNGAAQKTGLKAWQQKKVKSAA